MLKKSKINYHFPSSSLARQLLLFLLLIFTLLATLILLKDLYFGGQSIKKINDSFFEIEGAIPYISSKITFSEDRDQPSYTSFFESFYNKSNLDLEQTDLYIDLTMDAAMFSPDYTWQEISSLEGEEGTYFSSLNYNEFQAPAFYDQSCIKSNCLEQKGLDLFYNDRAVTLPVADGRLSSLSIGAVGNDWLVGLVWQKDGAYYGQAYRFNGRRFESLFKEVISSTYFGRFGFGGETDDFLVIYGAYRGQAYRLRGKDVIDISQYFSFRPMGGGFQARAIKSGTGNEVVWYVFSLSSGRPRLIKLWQNGGPEIVGAIDLRSLVLDTDTKSASIFMRKDSVSGLGAELVVEEKGNYGEISYHLLTDNGFYSDKPGQIVTAPNYQGGGDIKIRQLLKADITSDDVSKNQISLYFSAREVQSGELTPWLELDSEIKSVFKTETINYYILKLEVSPLSNKSWSPFISEIGFSYYCSK